MGMVNLIVGLLLIGTGFLVKAAPDLIAGYNTMPKDKKKHVDLDGLSTLMRNGLIIIGLLTIIGYYLFKWVGFSQLANSSMLIVILSGTITMAIKARKFDHNQQKKTKQTYFILGFTVVFVLGLIFYGFIPTKTRVSEETVKFSGMYGFEMKISEIQSIELVKEIPNIEIRTNGFSFGSINKGTFKLTDWGKCKLFVQSGNQLFLIINSTNGTKTIINDKNPTVTEDNYNKIKRMTQK